MSHRVFTIEKGQVSVGAIIQTLHLKGANMDIPAIIIGEEGRGRRQAAIPVGNPPQVPCPSRNADVWESKDTCSRCGTPFDKQQEAKSTRHHPNGGLVTGLLLFAEVGQTQSAKAKFFTKPEATDDEKVIVVMRTRIGFRGGNSHTGDFTGETKKGVWGYEVPIVAPFPGEVLAEGHIAQGGAGRMGGGSQRIALVPKDVWFRSGYSGRLYGGPSAHYYKWDGKSLVAMTWEERQLAT